MEPLMTYHEQRFEGKRTFLLFNDRLVIRGNETFSTAYEQTIRLEWLCCEFDRISYRSPSFFAGVKLAAGSFITVSVLHSGFGMPVGAYLTGLATVGVVAGLLLAFATRNRVGFAVFKSRGGADGVSIGRSGKQVADYDAFIQRLVEQIKSCEPNPETPKPLA